MTAARRAALSAAATALLLLAACGGDAGRAVPDLPASSAYVGKCAPDNPLARDGSGRLIARYGNGSLDDELALIGQIGQVMRDASICGLGQLAANAVDSAIHRLKIFDGAAS